MADVFVGIDADTRGFAWCALSGADVVACEYIPRSTTPVRKQRSRFAPGYNDAVRAALDWCRRRGAVVYLEAAFLPTGAHNKLSVFGALSEVQGEIKLMAREMECGLISIAPMDWQEALFGFHEPREEVKCASANLAANPFRKALGGAANLHQCDAYCIALTAQRFHASGRFGHGETMEIQY